jgi:hypothetical protein
LSQALSDAWSAAYRATTAAANLYEISRAPWTFLFDFSSATGAQPGRTIAA